MSILAMPSADAAPGLGVVKQHKLPTSTDPHEATTASDGNVWVTVQGAFDPETFNTPGSVARVTPRGAITEFAVCDGAADSTSVWFADFFNNRVGRFNVVAGEDEDPFTFFPAEGVGDVAVAPDGTVWFTGSGAIGQIDPAVGVVSLTPLSAEGSGITVARNGSVWATEPFADLVARLTPSGSGPHQLAEFSTPEDGAPLGIAAAPDGSVWFTQNLRGNLARITQDGVVTEASTAIDFADPSDPTRSGSRSAATVTRGTHCRSSTRWPTSGCVDGKTTAQRSRRCSTPPATRSLGPPS